MDRLLLMNRLHRWAFITMRRYSGMGWTLLMTILAGLCMAVSYLLNLLVPSIAVDRVMMSIRLGRRTTILLYIVFWN